MERESEGRTVAGVSCQDDWPSEGTSPPGTSQSIHPYGQATNAVEAGRSLTIVAGCNDCQTEGKILEEDWLTGSSLGWRDPWGTTYATVLRTRVRDRKGDAWVSQIHERHASPPMPWMNVNQWSNSEEWALNQYIESLRPKGDRVPEFVPPGAEPTTPYISLPPEHGSTVRTGRLDALRHIVIRPGWALPRTARRPAAGAPRPIAAPDDDPSEKR